ncbi:tail fiber assembly protein [Escherichia sp. E10V10]|uniref:tail fiber assembly protein n=1 Tax=Escherichia sp. E10V10 TaxID=2478970 RepID=UPI001029AB56|nr:tail fiber assembly protein [Escherichia sp. E10V10]RZN54919.1 tail fiber assembly protein [Escherichia sp. E10V10]
MRTYRYDAITNAFYPYELQNEYEQAGMWPESGHDVNEDIFQQFINPPAGKVRVAGNDGMPAWGDIPPPAHDELVAVADVKKAALLAEASVVIAPLADALAGGYIDDADVPRLAAWQKYRYALTKVDTSTAPDITWPLQPV